MMTPFIKLFRNTLPLTLDHLPIIPQVPKSSACSRLKCSSFPVKVPKINGTIFHPVPQVKAIRVKAYEKLSIKLMSINSSIARVEPSYILINFSLAYMVHFLPLFFIFYKLKLPYIRSYIYTHNVAKFSSTAYFQNMSFRSLNNY